MSTNTILTNSQENKFLSDEMEELMTLSAHHAKIFHQYFEPLKNNDFELFKEQYKNYTIEVNHLKPEEFKFSPDAIHLKELARCFENYPTDVLQLGYFFEKAHLVRPEHLLMLFYTQRCNDELGRRFNQKPCFKHEEYWTKGIHVSSKFFDAFCNYFNKENFLQQKDDFFSNQEKIVLQHHLENELPYSQPAKKKNKI